MMKKYYFDSQCPTTAIPLPLSLQDLAGLYMVLAGGIVFAFITVISSLGYKKLQLKAARDKMIKQTLFHFNKNYLAKVLLLRETGILIKVYCSERDFQRDECGKKPEHIPLNYSM